MLPEEAKAIAEHQRRRFNELVDVFDRPQPPEVMARLREIVASAELGPERDMESALWLAAENTFRMENGLRYLRVHPDCVNEQVL